MPCACRRAVARGLPDVPGVRLEFGIHRARSALDEAPDAFARASPRSSTRRTATMGVAATTATCVRAEASAKSAGGRSAAHHPANDGRDAPRGTAAAAKSARAWRCAPRAGRGARASVAIEPGAALFAERSSSAGSSPASAASRLNSVAPPKPIDRLAREPAFAGAGSARASGEAVAKARGARAGSRGRVLRWGSGLSNPPVASSAA